MLLRLQLVRLVGWGDSGAAKALRAGNIQARYWQPAAAAHQHIVMLTTSAHRDADLSTPTVVS
jgi:hypothetical protein